MTTALDVLSGTARWCVEEGDCLRLLRTLPDASIDSCVTDPPAGIGFMGRAWDGNRGGRRKWIAWLRRIMKELLRVLKPGAYALVWALPRTSHWTATAIEDAGFEVADVVTHLFAVGFPKSLNIVKAIEGAGGPYPSADPAAYAANDWAHEHRDGYGTALKPASEHWILAQKPLEGTYAANVLEHGTGALNIDGCRIGTVEDLNGGAYAKGRAPRAIEPGGGVGRTVTDCGEYEQPAGRWPANVVLSHAEGCQAVGTRAEVRALRGHAAGNGNESWRMGGSTHLGTTTETVAAYRCVPGCPVAALDAQSGNRPGMSGGGQHRADYGGGMFGAIDGNAAHARGDDGGASRFFFVSKPSSEEREAGCRNLPKRSAAELVDRDEGAPGTQSPRAGAGRKSEGRANHHPTVKAKDLLRHFIRLTTPPGGIVIDLFAGSGSVGIAAMLEQVRYIGVDLDLDDEGKPAGYVDIARARIAHWDRSTEARQQHLFGRSA